MGHAPLLTLFTETLFHHALNRSGAISMADPRPHSPAYYIHGAPVSLGPSTSTEVAKVLSKGDAAPLLAEVSLANAGQSGEKIDHADSAVMSPG